MQHKHFHPGTRPGGSVTGVTEKLFMCQMFMGLNVYGPCLAPRELSAPKSRDSLRLRRRFLPAPQKIARFLRAPRCAISSAKKIAEFLAMPSSAVKIASERRCAILVALS